MDNHTEYFLTIAEHKSISKAAEALLLSQPYLSQYVRKLEKDLGVRLFDRNQVPLKLTPAGQVYLDYVKTMNQLNNKLEKEIKSIGSNDYGTIVLGIPPFRSSYMLPLVMPSFHKTFPNVKIILREAPSKSIKALIQRKELDLAFMNNVDVEENIIYETLITERILLVTPYDLPEIRDLPFDPRFPSRIPLDMLANLPIVGLKPTSNLSVIMDNLFQRIDTAPDMIMHTDNVNTAAALTAAGLGCSLNSEMGVRYDRNIRDKVRFFTIGEPSITWDLSVIYHKDMRPMHYTQLLIDLFSKVCTDFRKDVAENGLVY